MKSILVKDIQEKYEQLDGKEIQVCGWVRSVRANGSIGFLDLNDGTAFKGLQVVFDEKLDNYEKVGIRVVGYLKKDMVISSGDGTIDSPYIVK